MVIWSSENDNRLQFDYTRAVKPVATCRQSPYLHKPAVDVILIMTSFATELATQRYGLAYVTYGHLAACNLYILNTVRCP